MLRISSPHVAKFEEADEGLPTIQVMIEVAQLSPGTPVYYTREEFQKMEFYLLRFFNWSVSFPALVHFSNYYLRYGCLLDDEEDPTVKGRRVDTAQLKEDMETYTTHFLEAALRGECLDTYFVVCIHVASYPGFPAFSADQKGGKPGDEARLPQFEASVRGHIPGSTQALVAKTL